MKTNIRFPESSDPNYVRQEVVGLVEKLLGGQALESEIQEATAAVQGAFRTADILAGSGMANTGRLMVGDFYAIANIDTGDFYLYRNVESTQTL